ncbi:uncharacterized protein LOC127003609 [Eriocheir sinensis]|uniref:uncharacterized protein LOC127003609 n=1 Tax=Eriocheir sinensis TaxID=95602 RepID=UPI0021CA8F47|nr:uncharacterized protein LOC127003609 [Eriocheir sinensis]
MTAAREEDLRLIIGRLEALGCNELETLEPHWVHSVLVSPGRPRQSLLMWVFAHLCPSEFDRLSSVPPLAHPQKILQSLICMGLCLPGDIDIIEGSAPEATQIKFWKTCLDTIHHLQNFSQPGKKETSDPQLASLLLSHLAHSPHLLPTLKGSETSLVPEDLLNKYHAWQRQRNHTPVSESLKKLENHLSEEKEKCKPLEKWHETLSSEEHQHLQTSIEGALTSLTKQQEVLRSVHTTYIAPWTASNTQLELPTTGPLVEQAHSKLSSIIKDLKGTEEILQNCEELEEQKRTILKDTQHPSSIITTLHSLVADSGRQHEVA